MRKSADGKVVESGTLLSTNTAGSRREEMGDKILSSETGIDEQSRTGTAMKRDWKSMSEEEKLVAMQVMSKQEISPEQVTGQVLKLCNVVRDRMDLRRDGAAYMKKRSGIGGTGGRELSPELRVRFGTFGFKDRSGK